MPVCKLCLLEKKLVKSHIVPRFMYETTGYFDTDHKLRTSTVDKIVTGGKVGRLPDGEYDLEILCNDCENVISAYETYASKSYFLDLSKTHENIVNYNGFLTISGLNYTRYKLFYLSILWRMSITTRPAFTEVHLGDRNNELLRQMIYYGVPLKTHQFPIMSSHYFNDGTMPHNLFVSPVQYDSMAYSQVLLLLNGYVHSFVVADKIRGMFNEDYLVKPNGTVNIRELGEGEAVRLVLNLQYGK